MSGKQLQLRRPAAPAIDPRTGLHAIGCECARCEVAAPSPEARARAEREARGRVALAAAVAKAEPKRLANAARFAAMRAQTAAELEAIKKAEAAAVGPPPGGFAEWLKTNNGGK